MYVTVDFGRLCTCAKGGNAPLRSVHLTTRAQTTFGHFETDERMQYTYLSSLSLRKVAFFSPWDEKSFLSMRRSVLQGCSSLFAANRRTYCKGAVHGGFFCHEASTQI